MSGRVTRNIGATGFGLVVTIVVQLASVPLFLHGFGLELYGEWLVVTAVPVYLSLSDLGFVSVAANEMTMRMAVEDRRGTLQAFQSAWVVMTGATVIAAGAMLAPLWLWSPAGLLHVRLMTHHEIALTLTLLFGYVVMTMQSGMLEAGFRCVGRFPRGNTLMSLLRLGDFGAAGGAVLLGAGPVKVAAAQLVARVVGYVAVRTSMRREIPWLLFGTSEYARTAVRRMVGPALAFLSFPVGNALALQGMVFAVSAALGAPAVVILNVVRTLAGTVRQFVNVINHGVWPEMSRAIAAGELPLARRLHVASLQGTLLATGLVAAAVVVVGQPLIHVWTGASVTAPQGFLSLMVLTVLLDSAWLTSSVVIASVNRHQVMASLYLASNLLALGLAFPLVRRIGLSGVPVSLFVVDIVLIGYTLRACGTILKQSPREFGRQLIRGGPPWARGVAS